jgi:XTP/dITP diphosphohydrolase
MNKRAEAFERVVTIMDELREKCPWDKKQTFESIRHLTIEETYELADAILEKDMDKIKKELGDLLLHIVFYSRMASETGHFTITEVMNSLCEKLIHRHPHIYGDVKADSDEQVKQNWEALKLKEGKNKSVLGGVPASLPALIKAMRIQEKAKSSGFDWEKKEQVWEKVNEELNEFRIEAEKGQANKSKIDSEFGDLLFSLINYARFIDVNPEEALERTNKKFIHRFTYLEEAARKAGKKLSDMTLAEMDVYWNEAKEGGSSSRQ